MRKRFDRAWIALLALGVLAVLGLLAFWSAPPARVEAWQATLPPRPTDAPTLAPTIAPTLTATPTPPPVQPTSTIRPTRRRTAERSAPTPTETPTPTPTEAPPVILPQSGGRPLLGWFVVGGLLLLGMGMLLSRRRWRGPGRRWVWRRRLR